MAAYLIVEIAAVHDEGAYAEYRARVSPGLERAGGRYLVHGGRTLVLEGSWAPPRLVVVEFPSRDAAHAWWDSREYAELRALRGRATDSRMLVADGVAGEGAGDARRPHATGAALTSAYAPPGYLLCDVAAARDRSLFADLTARLSDSLVEAGGRYLLRGSHIDVLEGPWRPRGLVLAQFPSFAAAPDAWRSPAVAPLAAVLRDSTTTHVVAVEGLAEAQTDGTPDRRSP